MCFEIMGLLRFQLLVCHASVQVAAFGLKQLVFVSLSSFPSILYFSFCVASIVCRPPGAAAGNIPPAPLPRCNGHKVKASFECCAVAAASVYRMHHRCYLHKSEFSSQGQPGADQQLRVAQDD